MIVHHKINMYQRRQKRVAGPGFHVNVKMDQFQIATMRGRNGVVGQSPLIPSSSQPEMYDIKEQEILVSKRTSGSMYHDGYTHVFSVVNGYDVGPLTDATSIKNKILEEVRFIGIATTEQKADDKLIDQGCVATVGGVQTIINNGTEAIHPGQKVMLDINLSPARASITREKGIPRQKVRFSVRPADDDLRLIGKAMQLCDKYDMNKKEDLEEYQKKVEKAKKARDEAQAELNKAKEEKRPEGNFRAARNAAEVALREARKNLKVCDNGKEQLGGGVLMREEDLQKFLQNYRHLNELVIGKAMSYAGPGDRFELLLQPRHSL